MLPGSCPDPLLQTMYTLLHAKTIASLAVPPPAPAAYHKVLSSAHLIQGEEHVDHLKGSSFVPLLSD